MIDVPGIGPVRTAMFAPAGSDPTYADAVVLGIGTVTVEIGPPFPYFDHQPRPTPTRAEWSTEVRIEWAPGGRAAHRRFIRDLPTTRRRRAMRSAYHRKQRGWK